jgi:hypothetical protein
MAIKLARLRVPAATTGEHGDCYLWMKLNHHINPCNPIITPSYLAPQLCLVVSLKRAVLGLLTRGCSDGPGFGSKDFIIAGGPSRRHIIPQSFASDVLYTNCIQPMKKLDSTSRGPLLQDMKHNVRVSDARIDV